MDGRRVSHGRLDARGLQGIALAGALDLAVYAVTGTSEGHYVHIDLIGSPGDNQVEHMAMVKTFSGWEKASLIAQAAGRLLGA